LSLLTPFFALAIYPAAYVFGFLNPVEIQWNINLARSGRPISEPIPGALQDRIDALNRYLNFAVDALIFVLVAVLSHKVSVSAIRIGFQYANWKRNATVGIIAAGALIAVQALLLRRVPIDPRHAFTSQVRKGSPVLWVCIFIAGASSEELWIAFSLVVLMMSGYSPLASVAMTIPVFAAMHYSYHFWGAAAVAAKGTVSALLFLHFHSLFVTVPFHFVGNLGSFYWNRFWAGGARNRVS
jgi:hypothetical protein